MRLIADLHAHSPYARATSAQCTVPGLAHGAKIKGINILATGDFTHPRWFQELRAHLEVPGTSTSLGSRERRNVLEDARDRSSITTTDHRSHDLPTEAQGLFPYANMHFILSVEVSCIYERKTQDGRLETKKMHHILLAPNFDVAAQINDRLKKYGDLASDGRPMLDISSAGLVEELMQISKEIVIIPSHCWTPWFSIFGSRSGVNNVEEAFEDQAKHIFALETGLSSDPEMNWMISALDKYTLVSNSDAHSLPNLGREANVFELEEISYRALVEAIRTRKGFVKTYEFYPEEGKYHYDGHRNCGVLLPPWESKKYGNRCPSCRRPLTIGVLHRVAELADRKYGFRPERAVPFQRIVPLTTVLATTLGKGAGTQGVNEEYDRLLRYFGNEFAVWEASDEQLRLAASPAIASALLQVKQGDIKWIPGHDGVFGKLILGDRKAGREAVPDKKQKRLEEF